VTRNPPLIAVIDDEESVRRAICRLLRSAGFDSETFPSGDEFIETFSQQQPDCIVLDLHMPKVDGFAVQAWLAKTGIRIPVVIITGRNTSEAHERAMKAGAVAYLRKPVDAEALLAAISVALGDGDSEPRR
jgi:FixJ family two-component response regulator